MQLQDLVGNAASLVSIVILIPQVYKTWKTKSAEDLSWGMLVLFFLNNILWLCYGLLISSFPLITANTSGLLVILILMWLTWSYRAR